MRCVWSLSGSSACCAPGKADSLLIGSFGYLHGFRSSFSKLHRNRKVVALTCLLSLWILVHADKFPGDRLLMSSGAVTTVAFCRLRAFIHLALRHKEIILLRLDLDVERFS